MIEEWKDVVGYEEYFKVSNLGRVYSKRTNKILKQCVSKTGYWTLSTRIGGRSGTTKCFKVHRLVAEAFIPNPENKPQVNHIDFDRLNNVASNLEWSTPRENTRHSSENGRFDHAIRRGSDNQASKLSVSNVHYIRENYIPYDEEYGARALGRKFGVNKSSILKIIKRESWNHI